MRNRAIHYLKVPYRYWMRFVFVLGEVNFTIIFSILFFVLLGPYAIVSMVTRKKQVGGWIEKKYAEPTVELLKRQF